MKFALDMVVRPTLLSILLASAFSAQAAQRVDLEKTSMPTNGLVANSIHSLTGLSSTELKQLRSKTFTTGTVVTRHQQFHQKKGGLSAAPAILMQRI